MYKNYRLLSELKKCKLFSYNFERGGGGGLIVAGAQTFFIQTFFHKEFKSIFLAVVK